MSKRWRSGLFCLVTAGLGAVALSAGPVHVAGYRLAEQWKDPTFPGREFAKLLVVGITSDQPTRHRFEDKFVTHLRGRIDGVTSYSLVPDLGHVEDRAAIVTTLVTQAVDGVVSVRLVPLDTREARDAWPVTWLAGRGDETPFRNTIESALAQSGIPASRYGLEVDLWDMASRQRVFSGRTDPYSMKDLRKGAGDFMQSVLDALWDHDLLPRP